MAGKLTDLDIGETSGVDHPAHLAEGWLLMKSRDHTGFGAKVAELLKDATTTCSPCGAMVAKTDAHCPDCGESLGESVEKSANPERLLKLHEALGRLIDGGGEMDEKTTPDPKVEKAESNEPSTEELLKSVPDAVRALFQKEREEREGLATELAKERERRETDEAVEKSASWAHVGIDSTEFGPTLRKLRSLDPDIAAEVEKALDGAEKIAEASDLFKSFGSGQTAGGGSTLEAMTKARQAEKPDEDYATAQTAVLATPEGQAAYTEVADAAKKGA